jgi:alcohol dehydrogenase (cytochrome c)
MRLRLSLLAAVAATGVVGLALPASAASTTPERLRNALNEPHNWLMNDANYSAWRYSKLAQINKNNVANLKVVFMASIGGNTTSARPNTTANEQSTPLVEDGFMYVIDSHDKVMKFDVSSGNRAFPLWRFDPKTERVRNTAGVALYKDFVIHATRDARIIGIGKDSGEAVFDVSGKEAAGGPNAADAIATRSFRGVSATLRTAGGKDTVVLGGGGAGVGWVGAFDANNGALLWRTYTIPQPGEPNFGTWPGDKWKWGGAVPWGQTSFDPDTNTIYVGTGEPSPVYDPEFRPGDNLYSSSTLALDADTGRIKWFFQETPNDQWDFDSTSTRILHDMVGADGRSRKVVTNWARNGFTYSLDRGTGEFLQAIAQTDNVNWTKGIDAKTGKPQEYRPGNVLQTYAVAGPRRGRLEKDAPLHCATWGGAPTGIWPAAFDPTTGITYQTRTGGCTYQTILKHTDEGFQPLARENLGSSIKQVQVNTNANLIAIDIKSGKVVNTYTRDLGIPSDRQTEVGALVTAGGLVFSGFDDGAVSAYDKDTLVELWRFNVGTGMKAPLITYSVGGKQYVAHIVGGDNPGNGIRSLIMPTAMLVVYGL